MIVVIAVRIDITEGGHGAWFHREMDIPFLPVQKMRFEFALAGQDSLGDQYHKHGIFVVDEVAWVEADGKIHIWLLPDSENPDSILVSDFDKTIWKDEEPDSWHK